MIIPWFKKVVNWVDTYATVANNAWLFWLVHCPYLPKLLNGIYGSVLLPLYYWLNKCRLVAKPIAKENQQVGFPLQSVTGGRHVISPNSIKYKSTFCLFAPDKRREAVMYNAFHNKNARNVTEFLIGQYDNFSSKHTSQYGCIYWFSSARTPWADVTFTNWLL